MCAMPSARSCTTIRYRPGGTALAACAPAAFERLVVERRRGSRCRHVDAEVGRATTLAGDRAVVAGAAPSPFPLPLAPAAAAAATAGASAAPLRASSSGASDAAGAGRRVADLRLRRPRARRVVDGRERRRRRPARPASSRASRRGPRRSGRGRPRASVQSSARASAASSSSPPAAASTRPSRRAPAPASRPRPPREPRRRRFFGAARRPGAGRCGAAHGDASLGRVGAASRSFGRGLGRRPRLSGSLV